MNGSNIFVDTNILIYLLDKDEAILALLNDNSIYISFITELELLSYRNYSSKEKEKLSELLNDCIIIDINPQIKKNAVAYRLKTKLKLPDSIIAATAQYLSLPLLTADKDFKRINEIDVLLYEK